MAAVLPANDLPGPSLKQRLARAERFNRLKSKALILPLLLFLLLHQLQYLLLQCYFHDHLLWYILVG